MWNKFFFILNFMESTIGVLKNNFFLISQDQEVALIPLNPPNAKLWPWSRIDSEWGKPPMASSILFLPNPLYLNSGHHQWLILHWFVIWFCSFCNTENMMGFYFYSHLKDEGPKARVVKNYTQCPNNYSDGVGPKI